MCNRTSCSHRLPSLRTLSARRSRTRAARKSRSRPNNALLYFVLAVIIFEEITQVAAGRDYYDILGVARDADSSTIKRAFRKLAVKYHPDKNPGDKTAEKMYVELNNAYEVLGDNSKRQRYDMYGEDGLRGAGQDSDDDGFDPFGGMFGNWGGRRRRQEERRVRDVVVPLSVSLEMLYNGGVIEASHKRRVICSEWSDCEKKCTRCGGRGIVIQTRRLGPGFVQQIQTSCPVCGGTGKISNPNCKSCPNGQFEEVEKLLLIDIEKGMTSGQTITFDGHTDEKPDHAAGNVHFEIDTQDHDRFQREGDDLHYLLDITLSEALVGVDRVVRQLDGRKVSIQTDHVISPKERIVIPGEGMPKHDGSGTGNMVVEFWVEFPKSLTEQQKKATVTLLGKPPSREETGDGTTPHGGNNGTDEEKTEL